MYGDAKVMIGVEKPAEEAGTKSTSPPPQSNSEPEATQKTQDEDANLV